MDDYSTRLEPLDGAWTLRIAFSGAPPVAGGRVTCEWTKGK
jgi:hypothetical protein